MYITCQQCETIFRLDESLLKSSGSKVRCCQCRNIFVAYPPASEKVASDVAAATAASAVPSAVSEAALDQELEGIDLAELDSILEQDVSFDEETPVSAEQTSEIDVGEEVGSDLNEDDLDLDFTIEPEEEKSVPEPVQEAADFEIDDLDMDFELDDGLDDTDTVAELKETAAESETKAGEEEVSRPITDEELDLELEQLDLSLGEDELAGEPEPVAEESAGAELDLADVDLALEEDTAEAEAAEPELELSLDDDEQSVPELETDQAAAAETDVEEIDDLDLSDLDSVLGLDDASDQKPLEMPEISDDEDLVLSLDDSEEMAEDALPGFELEEESDLDLDKEPVSESNEEPALELEEDLGLDEELALELEDELGLDEEPALELEDELSLDEEPALELEGELSLDEEPALELEDELSLDEEPVLELEDELSLDEEPALELEAEAAADVGDDLDLSDLDAMLSDADDGLEAEQPTVEAEELSLDLELDEDAGPAGPVDTAEEDLEDLSFELDSEFEDEPAVEQAEAKADAPSDMKEEELDLSDIEQMLESDETAATIGIVPEAAGSEEDGGERWAGDGEVELEDSDEFDLAEFEAAIDEAEGDIGNDDAVDEELSLGDELVEQASDTDLELDDLNLELESKSAAPEAETAAAAADSEELDLSDLEGLVEDQDTSATSETIDTGEIELEFEISGESMGPDAQVAQTAGADTVGTGATFSLEETVEQAFEEKPETDLLEQEAAPSVKKRSTSKGVLFLLIILLLGGAGYLFYAVSYMGLEIPYLSEYLNPKPKDPAGILNLATLDINSKFIENENAGRLFIVTGKVRNGKDTARRMIRLQGKLFTTGKVLAKTEFTYAGVSLKDQEISKQTITDIKKKINSTTGPASTVKVLPGQSVPFMIVFSDLPEGLDEFAIEVISSMQAP